MKKKEINIILTILAVVIVGFTGYKIFQAKKSDRFEEPKVTAQNYLPNICWIYHEFVYRVDFADTTQPPFFFTRNGDGSFSPSMENQKGNDVTGNGLLIDSTGALIISDQMAHPWELSVEDRQLLGGLIDTWRELRAGPESGSNNSSYSISGQTVALYVVLNDPKEFIEYEIGPVVPGQDNYTVIYPVNQVDLRGIQVLPALVASQEEAEPVSLQVLSANMLETDREIPLVSKQVDSIMVSIGEDGKLEDLKVLKGDDSFLEGSAVLDENANLVGYLRYRNQSWHLARIQMLNQDRPVYDPGEVKESWEFDKQLLAWRKVNTASTDQP